LDLSSDGKKRTGLHVVADTDIERPLMSEYFLKKAYLEKKSDNNSEY